MLCRYSFGRGVGTLTLNSNKQSCGGKSTKLKTNSIINTLSLLDILSSTSVNMSRYSQFSCPKVALDDQLYCAAWSMPRSCWRA